ncbi:MAG: LacI family DNA-binding transcriptional regulator [Roseburia sp.]|nr:LacI family DNA-binding transcriptional regulator [Roseburia sp.]MCM1557140.1 LacI family DNA-binding transcriptional regulator [Anaeroplasma bactoclasticum]
MSITAKELAKLLNLSEAAISMALNNKPGVSTYTKNLIWDKAKELGYDFSKIERKNPIAPIKHKILFAIYHESGAIVSDTPFFTSLFEGINQGCKDVGFQLYISDYYQSDNLDIFIKTMLESNYAGIILLGTEIGERDLKKFIETQIPIVLLDSYFETELINCVTINNNQGAYIATQNLIKKYKCCPGYLQSSYSIQNFKERADGYFKAIRTNGFSTSSCTLHKLSPSIEGAYYDMLEILNEGILPQRAYFADNDLIAAGAIKAFLEKGYKVPNDIAVVGFDNTFIKNQISPYITTIDVPKAQMGIAAVKRLNEIILGDKTIIKNEIFTKLLIRETSI